MEGETLMESDREPGCTLAGNVRSKDTSPPLASDTAARGGERDAWDIDRQVELHRVRLFIGERFAGDAWQSGPVARARGNRPSLRRG